MNIKKILQNFIIQRINDNHYSSNYDNALFDMIIVFNIDDYFLKIGYWSEYGNDSKLFKILDYTLYVYELQEPLSNAQNKIIVHYIYDRLGMKVDFEFSSKEEKFYTKHIASQKEFVDFFKNIYLELDQQLGIENKNSNTLNFLNFFKKYL
jgi:hypothetical protein